jgi:hypothetical protein
MVIVRPDGHIGSAEFPAEGKGKVASVSTAVEKIISRRDMNLRLEIFYQLVLVPQIFILP